MDVRCFALANTEAVVQLWSDCGLTRSWNNPYKDIERKLSVSPELFLVGCDAAGQVMASIMVGYDGHRGWVNYLAVHPSHQRRGRARALMQQAEQLLARLGCPKLSLQVRTGNQQALDFYTHLGYIEDQTVTMGKRLIADV